MSKLAILWAIFEILETLDAREVRRVWIALRTRYEKKEEEEG